MRTEPPRAPGSAVLAGSVLAVVFGVAAAWVSVALVGRVLSDCDIGIGGPANGLGLMLQLPVLAVVDIAVFGTAFALVFRRAIRSVPPLRAGVLATVAGLVPLALLAWGVVAWNVPADYPGTCAGGRPAWWPGWLPV